MPLSVCCMTHAPPGRVAAMLELLRPVADEIVVAADDRIEEAGLSPLVAVADRVIRFPYARPTERATAWLHAQCSGDWTFRIDADEIASPALVEALPALTGGDDLTHYWVPRLWLWPDTGRFLDTWPWRPDYQPRLIRNDPALARFPGAMHSWPVVLGPSRSIEEPVYHAETLAPRDEREGKARRYERLRPGRRQAGLPMNQGVYVPERRGSPRTAPVPEGDRAAIDRVVAGGAARPRSARRRASADAPSSAAPAPIGRAERSEIDRLWEGRALGPGAYRARLELLDSDRAMVQGEHRAFDVRVQNLGDETWPWGPEGRPAIRLSYRWRDARGEEATSGSAETPLPAPLHPGDSARVPVEVAAPSRPGRFVLELDVVHSRVRWFGCAASAEIDVVARRRVAFMGGFSHLRDVGADAALSAHLRQLTELAPEFEPILLGEQPEALAERFGHRSALSVEPYLLDGLSRDTRRSVALPRLAWRTAVLVRAARELRDRGVAPRWLAASGRAFLEALAGAELLVAVGAGSMSSHESIEVLWPQAAGILAADALGIQVVVSGITAGPFEGAADRALAGLALRRPSLITVRDRGRSARALRRLAVPRGRIREGADDAVALEPALPELVDEQLAVLGLEPETPFAAVSLAASPASLACATAVAGAIDRLAQHHGLAMVFVPMRLQGRESDDRAARTLLSLVEAPERFHVLHPLPEDDLVLGVVGRARLALGTRYLLSAFATTRGVPAVGVLADDRAEASAAALAGLGNGSVALLPPGTSGEELASAAEAQLARGAGQPVEPAEPLPSVRQLLTTVGVESAARAARSP